MVEKYPLIVWYFTEISMYPYSNFTLIEHTTKTFNTLPITMKTSNQHGSSNFLIPSAL